MIGMRNNLFYLLLLGCAWMSGLLQAGTTNELDALQTGRLNEMARLEGVYALQKSNALSGYRKMVDTQMLAVKQKGDLDAYLVLEAEKKRMLSAPTVNTNDVPALEPLVAQYAKAMQDAARARDQANLNLLRLYVGRLTALMQNQTRADRLDDAKRTREELQTAKTELTFLEADAPPAVDSKPVAAPPVGVTPPPAEDPVKRLAGTWTFTWRNNGRSGTDTIILNPDGTASCPKEDAPGTWEIKDRQCLIHWPKTENRLTITDDGKHMIGFTRQGASLSAVKTGN